MFYLPGVFSMCKTSLVLISLQALLFLGSTEFGQADSFSKKYNPGSMSGFTYLACGIRVFKSSGQGYRQNENVGVLKGGRNIGKILRGNNTIYGEIPWQANIRKSVRIRNRLEYRHSCGAAIVSEFWLLSAAHCLLGTDPVSVRVVVGDYHLNRKDKEQMFELDKIIIHELFEIPKHDYDIALIKIKRANNTRGIRFNDKVQPICLPNPTEHPAVGTKLTVSGWGRYSYSGKRPSEVLQKTLLPVMSQKVCNEIFHKHFRDHMVCAGYVNGKTDMCQGDSGGPATYKSGGIYILYGIVSFGTGCPLPHYPVVLASVQAFLSWIESNIIAHSDNDLQRIIPGRPIVNQ